MFDARKRDAPSNFAHCMFDVRWWSGSICPGVFDLEKATTACCQAIGWASR